MKDQNEYIKNLGEIITADNLLTSVEYMALKNITTSEKEFHQDIYDSFCSFINLKLVETTHMIDDLCQIIKIKIEGNKNEAK